MSLLQGSTQGHWRFPEEGHEQGLVYLMTHPGTPCMFYDDLLDDRKKSLMQTLIALRQNAGIHCRSEVSLTSSFCLFCLLPPLIGTYILSNQLCSAGKQGAENPDIMRQSWFYTEAKAFACLLQVYIMHAQKFLYVAEIDKSLLMKIGKAKYEPDSTKWKPLESGKNWGIWQRA